MSDADRIIALARTQIGTAENPPGSNNVIYNTDYYGIQVSGADYPWCCAFIWWLFWKLSLSHEFCGGAKTAYCPYVVNYALNTGRWITNAAFIPGDLLLYDWNGDGIADHIGLCTAWYGSFGSAIEGNTNDAVQEVSRSIGSIMGAYRPAYGGGDQPQPEPQPGPGPDQPDTYVVQDGDSLWSIAEKLLGSGVRWIEIYELNNLPTTVIYPGQILKIPRSDSDHDPDPEPAGSVSVELPQLRRGSSGRDVETLQLLLQRWHFSLPVCGVDGELGQETETALQAFQREWGLEASGMTDAATWRSLICG